MFFTPKNSSLEPLIDLLQRFFDLSDKQKPQEKISKIESTLKQYPFSIDEVLPLFASLLGIPFDHPHPTTGYTPLKQKEKTLDAMIQLLVNLTKKNPVLFIAEDIQWVDPSTMDFFNLLLERLSELEIFLVFTGRTDFKCPWESKPHLTTLTLDRLSNKDITNLIENITGNQNISDELLKELVHKADGIPLFAEELTKMLLESAAYGEDNRQPSTMSPPAPLSIPDTLHHLLLARLDRMTPIKELVQLAATFGREFTYTMLKAASGLDGITLQGFLNQLLEAELLYQESPSTNSPYIFKHALIQEEAYQTMIKTTRKKNHVTIAKMIVEQFPEISKSQPELVAHHFTHGESYESALDYWYLAGQSAIQQSANVEAAHHIAKGLEIIGKVPRNDPHWSQKETELLILQGLALIAIKGYGAEEVKEAFDRARQISQLLEENSRLFPALHGLWSFYLVRGEFRTALEIAETLNSLARKPENDELILEANFTLGLTLTFLGKFDSAQHHFQQAIIQYVPAKHNALAFQYGQDPGVGCLAQGSWALWIQGYPEKALYQSKEALSLAKALEHPHSIAFAYHFRTHIQLFCGEYEAALKTADQHIKLSREYGFPFWLNMALILKGGALIALDKIDEGQDLMREGYTAHSSLGSGISNTYWLYSLAQGLGNSGKAKEGLNLLDEALRKVSQNAEAWWEPELYRLKGLLLKQIKGGALKQFTQKLTGEPTVEECLLKAVALSKKEGQRSLELRALISLVRFQRESGSKETAQQELQAVYNSFSEGHETADLKNAKKLLTGVG